MAKDPPDGMQRVIRYLSHADAPKAIDFLCRAFGFEERLRFPMPDGRLGHAGDCSLRVWEKTSRLVFEPRARSFEPGQATVVEVRSREAAGG